MDTLKALLSDPATVALLISGALGLVGLVVGTGAVRRRRVALAVYHAFHIVEDLDAEVTGDTKADRALAKTKLFLAKADAYCVANGWRPLKAGEQEVALLQASAQHGSQKVALRLSEMSAPLVMGTGSEPVPMPPPGIPS